MAILIDPAEVAELTKLIKECANIFGLNHTSILAEPMMEKALPEFYRAELPGQWLVDWLLQKELLTVKAVEFYTTNPTRLARYQTLVTTKLRFEV